MKRTVLLISFIFATFIYAFNLWYSTSGVFLFLATVTILALSIFFPQKIKLLARIDYYTSLSLVLILFTIISFTLEASDVNGLQSLAMWGGRILMLAATLVSLLYLIKSSKKKFIILLVLSFLIQLSLLRIVRIPDVDIYNIVKYGPLKLIAGQNPYVSPGVDSSKSFSDFHYEYYTYGPASIFLFLPSDILFKDPRYMLIACNFLVAFTLYKIAKLHGQKSEESEMLGLIYLFHPRYPNLLVNSVTDVLIVALIAFALLSLTYKKFWQAGVGLALLTGVKILYAIPLIFLFKYKKLALKTLVISGFLCTAALHIPFLIINSQAFLSSTIFFYMLSSYSLFLPKAVITLAAFLNRQWGYLPPVLVYPIINVVAFGIFWLLIKPTIDLSKTLTIVGFVFLVFLFLSHLALPGYYFVASSFLIFAIAFTHEQS